MYKPKSLKINVIARSFVGFVELAFSLFTFPYIAKILGPHIVGQIDYATAAVSYFVMIGAFGIDQYGGREVAQNRTHRDNVDDILSRLFGFRAVLCLVLFLVYIGSIIVFQKDNLEIFYCSSFMIISTLFNLVWALEVLEDFTFLAVVRFISKCLFIVYLVSFVQSPQDVIKYFLSLIACDFLYYLASFIRLKYFYHVTFDFKKMLKFLTKKEFKSLVQIFFIILVQSSISGIPSIVMGRMSLFHELGILSTAQRFFWIGYYAIIPLSTVLQSRSMSFSHDCSSDDRNLHIDRTANALMTFSIPISLGLILIAPDVVPLLVGQQYLDSIFLLQILSPLIVLYSCYNFWSMQVVFSRNGDKELVGINIIGLISMALLSLVLIPRYHAIGAIAANLTTFLILSFVSFLHGRKLYSIHNVKKDIGKTALAGSIMYLSIFNYHATNYFWLGLKIAIGAFIYFLVLYIAKHTLIRKIIKFKN